MIRAATIALAITPFLAGCGKGDPIYEKMVLDDVPTKNAVAMTAFFRECGSVDGQGNVICHACTNDMFLETSGEIHVYSDNNEYTIEHAPAHPYLTIEGELSHNTTHIEPADGARERAKGPASFEKYLTGLFDDGNKWCATLGGERHDLKNRIADAAHGKDVVTK